MVGQVVRGEGLKKVLILKTGSAVETKKGEGGAEKKMT